MEKIKEILGKYSPDDAKLFSDTIEMLCSKGVGKGCYQDFTVLVDILEILSACERIIKRGDLN